MRGKKLKGPGRHGHGAEALRHYQCQTELLGPRDRHPQFGAEQVPQIRIMDPADDERPDADRAGPIQCGPFDTCTADDDPAFHVRMEKLWC